MVVRTQSFQKPFNAQTVVDRRAADMVRGEHTVHLMVRRYASLYVSLLEEAQAEEAAVVK